MTPTEILQLVLITIVLATVIFMGALADYHAGRADAKAERAHEEIVELRKEMNALIRWRDRHMTTPAAPEPERRESLGTYRITVYTPHCDGGVWGYATATGARSEHLATCAVDPSVIPLGTVLEVGGLRVTAVDTGSAVKGKVIDVFYDGRTKDALGWLRQQRPASVCRGYCSGESAGNGVPHAARHDAAAGSCNQRIGGPPCVTKEKRPAR